MTPATEDSDAEDQKKKSGKKGELPIVEKFYVASIGLALVTAVLFCSVRALPPGPSWGKILLAMVALSTVVGLIGRVLDFRRARRKRTQPKSC